jgi:vitamin B12 transporter
MKRTAAIATLCLQASAGVAFGAEDGTKSKTDAFTLGEVVVTSPQQTPTPGQINTDVSQQDIQDKGARTLDEALRSVPGLQITSGPQGIPRIMIRGLPPRETQIFLNGTPLNSAADGQPDPTLVPTENIDHIEVIQGATSVLYGPGTTAGAIDIITKQGTTGFHGDAGSEIGMGNARRAYGDVSGGFSDFNYFISGSHTAQDSSPVPSGAGGGFRANSDLQRSNLYANFGAKIGDWRLALTMSSVNGNQGLPPNLLSSATNLFTSGQKFERLDRIAGQNAQFDAAYLPGGPFSFRATAYVNASNYADNLYDNIAYNSMVNPTVQTATENIATVVSGGRLQAKYDFGAYGTLTSSLMMQHEQETISGATRNVAVVAAGAGAGAGAGKGGGGGKGGGAGAGAAAGTTYTWALLNQDNGITTYSAAVEYKVDPFARTHLTAGYSHHWFDGVNGLDQGDQGVVGLAYDLTQTLQAFASFSHKVRFPTIDQLYNPQMGNAALVPEVSNNLEGGLTWRPTTAAQVTASVFKNRVNNFILNNMTTQTFFNSDVVIQGVQASASYVVIPGLTVRPGYTYLDTRYPSTDLPVDYRPHHVVNLLTTFAPGAGWLLSADASYVAAQSVGERSNAYIRLPLSSYAVLNAKIQKSFPEYGLDVYVRGTNLTDTPYTYAVGFPAPGRSLYAGLEYHF